jgi:hypothetical protein
MGNQTKKMERIDLERFLENDCELGFEKETNNPNYVGWILLRKEKVNKRYLSILNEGEDPLFVRKQQEIAEKPYILRIFELKKSVYNAQVYEGQEDYRINIHFRFASLEEIETFLKQYDKKLEEIKWLSEINAP